MLDNLPRGSIKIPNSNPKTHNVKKLRKKNKSKMESEAKEDELNKNDVTTLYSVNDLTHSTLQEGMNILGRVYETTDYHIIVALPGQINGQLSIFNISEAYTKLLKNITQKELLNKSTLLSDLYKKGDYLICYVKESNPHRKRVLLSTEPRLINQTLNLSSLKVLSKVTTCIKSVEDHGCNLETGLNNFQAFLPFDKVVHNYPLYPGKQITCVITDIKNVDNHYITNVSALSNNEEGKEFKISSVNNFIPSTKFCLIVTKILHNGLQVHFNGNRIGCVNYLYLHKPLHLFKIGQKLDGILLYILPILKIAFFSLVSQKHEQKNYSSLIGSSISNVKVLTYDRKGVIVELNKNVHGFIPSKHTEIGSENIASNFSTGSLHKCKITAYDLISKLYICSIEKNVIEETSLRKVNFNPGDKADVTVTNIDEINKLITVSVGKAVGIIPRYHMSDPETHVKLVVGQSVAARVLESSGKLIFTLKKSLIDSEFPILHKIENASLNSVYHGTVLKITNKGVLVHFFGNVKGWILKPFPSFGLLSCKSKLTLGQTVSVIVKNIDTNKNKLLLSLFNGKKECSKVNVGDIVDGTVVDSSIDGVHIRVTIEGKDEIAFLPASHMSPCEKVGKLLAMKTIAGYQLSAIVFSTIPQLILSTTFSPKNYYKLSDLAIGKLVMCTVVTIDKDFLNVLVPIENFSGSCKIYKKSIDNFESIHENKILLCKILDINKKTYEIKLTAQLNQICNELKKHDLDILTAVDVLNMYLSKISDLSRNIYYADRPISKFVIGQRIKATVETTTLNGLVLKLDNNVKGIVQRDNFYKSYKPGDKVEGLIVWINYPHECIEITLLLSFHKINSIQNKLSQIPTGIQLRGVIVLINDWFVMVVLTNEKKGSLVALPTRRNLNDTVPDLTLYKVGSKVKCYGIVNRDDSIPIPICIIKSAFEMHNYVCKKSPNSLLLKRKSQLECTESHVVKKLKNNDKENVNLKRGKSSQHPIKELTKCNVLVELRKDIFMKKEKESCTTNQVNSDQNVFRVKKEETDNESSLVISECGFNWENNLKEKINYEINSFSCESEDETKLDFNMKKEQLNKKSITRKKKEKEVCKNQNAISNYQIPQSIDQFERLVLANPNSSFIWIQYMTYHLHGVEVDKARSVARRALNYINLREEGEKLNIWKALLNLESQFGSPESLNEVFQNALKMNNTKMIFKHMLIVHAEAGRTAELENITNKMLIRFKHDIEVWIICETVFFKIGMCDQARNIMQKAKQCLPKSKYIEFTVKFALLESKFGSKEKAQTLFENILSSYPKKTDIWSKYVDVLIKSKDFDIARKVLDRALSNTMPLRKMKFIFKKYVDFEERFGTPANVSRIKQMAIKYIEKQCDVINVR